MSGKLILWRELRISKENDDNQNFDIGDVKRTN
jgi:hypothetical protein